MSSKLRQRDIKIYKVVYMMDATDSNFSLPGRSPGKAIVLPPAAAAAASALAKCVSFYVKGFCVMGKALSGELSCPCDRSF